jgi:FeS assembly SUF system regulator
MLKISRLMDYSVVILRHLAQKKETPASARDLAFVSGLPLPTVSKLLKVMSKHQIVAAKRGSTGGYELALYPPNLSLLRLIEIIDGPPATTACMTTKKDSCQIHPKCTQRQAWQMVQHKVTQVLSQISLHDLIDELPPSPLLPLEHL